MLPPLPFGLVNLAGWCCYLTPKNFPAHVQKDRIDGAGIDGGAAAVAVWPCKFGGVVLLFNPESFSRPYAK